MSRTRTSRELALTAEAHGWGLQALETIALTGLEAGFAPQETRRVLREEVVLPAFRAARTR